MKGKIPVILVTGFLGSGKTTFLRRLAANYPEWRMIFLVNEFSDNSIDQLTLDTTGTPTQSVVGGSLFCECKAAEFVRVMKDTVRKEHLRQPLDAVIVETSGIANPQAIGQLMSQHGLSEHFEIRRIVCVVAAKRFISMLRNLPSVQAQIRTSDLIILNKTDLVEPSVLDNVEIEIRKEHPGVAVVRASYCDIPFDLSLTAGALPPHPLFRCSDNPFRTKTVIWPQHRSVQEAETWIQDLPPTILRVKGSLTTPENTWHVERSVDCFDIAPISRADSNNLVLICHRDHEADLQAAIESLHS